MMFDVVNCPDPDVLTVVVVVVVVVGDIFGSDTQTVSVATRVMRHKRGKKKLSKRCAEG